MKKLLLGALSLGIPGPFFFGNVTYVPRAEALEREACTFHDDGTDTNPVLTLRCTCGESSCSETGDVAPFFIMEGTPCWCREVLALTVQRLSSPRTRRERQ